MVLEALTVAFGDQVRFEGPLYGLVWLILVVTVMLVAEELLLRFYRYLGDPEVGSEKYPGTGEAGYPATWRLTALVFQLEAPIFATMPEA